MSGGREGRERKIKERGEERRDPEGERREEEIKEMNKERKDGEMIWGYR